MFSSPDSGQLQVQLDHIEKLLKQLIDQSR
jgi:hypothetical protein